MKFRNLIFVLMIAFSAIFLGMLGTSYAYYLSSGGANIDVTTGNIDTGIAVIFTQTQYINVKTGVPISSSDVDTLASKSIFTITPNADILSNDGAAINISIVDIAIDSNLRVSDFKYKLSCDDGTVSRDLGSGTGNNFTNAVISSGNLNIGTLNTSDGTFDVNKTYTCTLRVWLEETDKNQNSLMNKNFRGLIKVNTLFRKK